MPSFYGENPPDTEVGSTDATESQISEDAVTETDTSGGFYQGSPEQTTTEAYEADARTARDAALAAQEAAEDAQAAAEASESAASSSESNAASSQSAAATSATNASNSASAAAGSATTAATQASNAASSATAAASSASAAASSESAAASSQSAAASSQTAAAGSATAAASSAGTASTKASEAATSATNAAASESAAASSESNASTSASQAATSATNAAASESAAASSETNAASSASAASTSASNAASSASAASSSATAAASSASSASTSATAAGSARDAALAALDSFDDRYLGQKSSDPSLDNDGNALVAGALYFDTVNTVMKVYDGSQWLAAYASVSGALLAINNLDDVSNTATARSNLGLGTAAEQNVGYFATAAQGSLADSALQNGDNVSVLTNDSGYLTGNETITLTGDVSGSGTTSISVTIADDSHNHVISNVDGLQAALDAKQDASTALTTSNYSTTLDGRYYTETEVGTFFSGASAITGYNKTNWDTAYGWGDHGVEGYLTGNQTITLTGDVSGSGTTSIAVTIADDSHNHVISNVDGLQSALDAKLASSSYTAADVLTKIKTVDGSGSGLDADLLDGQHASAFAAAGHIHGRIYSETGTTSNYLALSATNELELFNSSGVVQDLYLNHSGGATSLRGPAGSYVWTSGNDGASSGLDADLLDGVQGSSYLRSDANDTATGLITFSNTLDAQITLDGSGTTWAGIKWQDVNGSDYIWYNGQNSTFAIGGGGSNVAGKKLHVDGGMSVGSSADATATPTDGIYTQGGIFSAAPITYRLATHSSGEAWHDQIHLGRYDFRYTASGFPNYLPGEAFGIHVNRSSDAAFFGLVSRGANSNDYNCVIAWGDDSPDDILQFRFNNSVKATLDYNANFVAVGSHRAPVFYDYNDTGFYVDPNGTSLLRTVYTQNSNYHFRPRYTDGTDSYSGSFNWYGLQLGNNGTNYIVAGRTAAGGRLDIFVNNTNDFPSVNGTHSSRFDNDGIFYNYYSVRSPIFYDSIDTAFYVDPNSTSRIRKTNLVASGWGWDDGLNLYSYDQTNRWNLLVDGGASNAFRVAFNNSEKFNIATSGEAYLVGGLRADIYYDRNDTAYYVNPASNGTRAGYLNGNLWINPKSESYGEGIVFNMPSQSTWGGLRWYRNGAAGSYNGNWAFGYFGNEASNDIGFHNGTNGWRLDHSFHCTTIGSFRAPIFYDSNNTGYYVDPASGTRLGGFVGIGGSPGSDDGGWGARLNVGGAPHARLDVICQNDGIVTTMYSHQGQGVGKIGTMSNHPLALMAQNANIGGYVYSGSLRSSIFYDYDSTAYYVNPNGTSVLHQVNCGTGTSDKNGEVSLILNDGTLLMRASGDNYHKIWYYDGIAFGTNNSHGHFRFYGETNSQRDSNTPGYALRFDIDATNGNCTAGGNVTAYSDIRLKEGIEVIPEALSKVRQIRGVTFTRNDQDNERRHAGVIAQEVEAVLPEVVHYNEEADVKTVAYGNMVGLLIEAIKEQQTQIEAMAAEIKSLKEMKQ